MNLSRALLTALTALAIGGLAACGGAGDAAPAKSPDNATTSGSVAGDDAGATPGIAAAGGSTVTGMGDAGASSMETTTGTGTSGAMGDAGAGGAGTTTGTGATKPATTKSAPKK